MSGPTLGLLLLAAMLALLAAWAVYIYNRLVTLRQRVQNAFAQIDVQLKRRYNLIPNLVEAVKGYMKHERQTLEAVIQARNSALDACNQAAAQPAAAAILGLASAETTLTGALGRFLGLVENYPELKAVQNVSQLMEELASTENKVAFARQAYNDAVARFNTCRESFPNVLVAGAFSFEQAQMLRFEGDAFRKAVKVSLQ